jgi:signal transduction histidine kinase
VSVTEPADELWDSSVSVSPPSEDTVRLVYNPRAVGRAVAHASLPRQRGYGAVADVVPVGPVRYAAEELLSRRRQLRHDIRHELATIMVLASLLEGAPDVGPDSRRRVRQILGEARWLDDLQRAYDATCSDGEGPVRAVANVIRLDLVAKEVVDAIRLSTPTTIGFTASAAWVYADRLALWRALRNMVDNAVRAAGPNGRVEVAVERAAGWAVAEVADNGPGFGAAPAGTDSLGLEIVRRVAADWNGHLEISRSSIGGCRVRLRVGAASPGDPAAGLEEL